MSHIVIRTHDGIELALLQDTIEWDFARVANDIGWFTLRVNGDLDRRLLHVDNLLEFYRTPPGTAPILLGVGMLRYWEWGESGGTTTLTLGGPDQMDLLNRRIVAYKSPEANWSKSDFADDMIKAVVRENMGTLATDPWYNRGRSYRAANFSVAPDEGRGKSVELSFQFRNVLAVLQEISDASAWPSQDDNWVPKTVLFDCDYIAPAVFLFRTWVPMRGVDRTIGSAISPIIFSREAGNLDLPTLRFDYTEEENIVYGLGQGTGTSRTVDPENDVPRENLSIWNLREGIEPATEEDTIQGVAWRAFLAMQEARPRVIFSGDLVDTPQTRFGVEWGYGDLVTIQHMGMQFDGRVDSFNVHSGADGETVRAGVTITKALEGKPD
jgi:hypothetical protein